MDRLGARRILRNLFRLADDHVVALGAGHRALDQQQIVLVKHLDDLEVLRRAPDVPHVTGHFHPAHDRAGEQALADRAAAAMPAFRAVGAVTAGKMVALDDALEPLALRHADGINEIADGKNIRTDNVARLHVEGEVAELADALDRRAVEFLDVTEDGFGEALFLLIVETELHGLVAVLAVLAL